MIVISDSSPIIGLATIGQLDLLRLLYGDVHIPEAVYHEIVLQGTGRPGAAEVQTQPWFHCHRVTDTAMVALLRNDLGEGEADAVALALELKADFLLIDEQAARGVALQLGLSFIGLMGVLLRAKAAGHLPAVRPVLDDLIGRAGFWVSANLYAAVLNLAGE